jgi:eukaryotic-like serine/threonine-protein kinase
MAVEIGTRLGRYEIRARLGAGGMGEVYLAHDTQLRRPVALKVLPQLFTKDEDRVRRFEQEAHAASALNHPYIITIHEIGSESGTHFIATEFIDGESLRQRMGREGLKLGEALEISVQAASAISAAHEAGIIHRDIKPENIMLRRDGYVKVLDFGLAKLTEKSSTHRATDSDASTLLLTEPGTILGTVQYLSPEQARALPVDERTDIWSLGCVLYEMVAGRAPFQGETASHFIVSILESHPAKLMQLRPDAPVELERIVEKALAKDREARYQTVQDLMIDLRALKQRLEFNAEMERSPPQELTSGTTAATQDRATAETIIDSVAAVRAREAARPTSSVEYIIGGIKSHKKAALVVAAILVAVTSASIYFYNFERASTPAKSEAVTPVSESAIDSIAVLPLTNVGAKPESEYLSDGITDGIINSLSKLSHLKVIARSSVFQYKGKETNPQEVARQLNVRAVVTGRLVQKGDELSISVELTDVISNRQLWGEQYNRKLSDILEVQQNISREISEKLRLKLTGTEEEQLAKRPTDNNEAYRLYLLGVYTHNQMTNEGVAKAIETYKQAIGKDPNFSLAYVALSSAYSDAANQYSQPREVTPLAREAALKALQIDDNLAGAYSRLAWVKFTYDYDPSGADRDFRRAIELDPGSFTSHAYYGLYLGIMNRPEEAILELKRADELDPLEFANKVHLGLPYVYSREYDKAIEQFQKTVDIDPTHAYARQWLGIAYLFKGMHEKAIEEFEKAGQADAPHILSSFGMTYGFWGKDAEAQRVLDKLKELSKDGYVPAIYYANVYASLGEDELALDWLEKAYEYRDPILIGLKYDPTWDGLRSKPRFIELLRKTGHSL